MGRIGTCGFIGRHGPGGLAKRRPAVLAAKYMGTRVRMSRVARLRSAVEIAGAMSAQSRQDPRLMGFNCRPRNCARPLLAEPGGAPLVTSSWDKCSYGN